MCKTAGSQWLSCSSVYRLFIDVPNSECLLKLFFYQLLRVESVTELESESVQSPTITMLIKEYRIPLPLTVEEYRIAQLYMIQVQHTYVCILYT